MSFFLNVAEHYTKKVYRDLWVFTEEYDDRRTALLKKEKEKERLWE